MATLVINVPCDDGSDWGSPFVPLDGPRGIVPLLLKSPFMLFQFCFVKLPPSSLIL
jgi:hypothetical protein